MDRQLPTGVDRVEASPSFFIPADRPEIIENLVVGAIGFAYRIATQGKERLGSSALLNEIERTLGDLI